MILYFLLRVLSLSSSFGENSSWIVFLEEETNVKMAKLAEVLAKFDKSKVSVQYLLNLISVCLYLFFSSLSLSYASVRPKLTAPTQLIVASVER